MKSIALALRYADLLEAEEEREAAFARWVPGRMTEREEYIRACRAWAEALSASLGLVY